MTLNENDKAYGRQFLSSESGKNLIEYCIKSFHPKLDMAKVPLDIYYANLVRKGGWEDAFEFLRASCVEQIYPDYGAAPIDTVRD